jgi:bifunctional DNA-binding transcriptional regulator/antitoxin component of YhaV-PrlF toxin-antitoxin module
MEITKLSPEGEVIIPQFLRHSHHWDVGQEFIIIDMGNGILLQPKKPFPLTKLEDVAGCLKCDGEPATLEDMEDAIRQGVEEIQF